MSLGCFSISLSVKDLSASKSFYEKLGFSVYAGEMAHGFLIMKNGGTNIGLFQGMFEGNIITFNPGWDSNAQPLDDFDDVRTLKQQLTNEGIEVVNQSLENDSGPGNFSIIDPDGNAILFDQHV
ncbi:VOC family protein [Thalassotalea sp. M1531]|uniref:VOC family protein n=1 Tax=Thalassotalea algicola TaxID=2716224 RepID=A0A7Y0LDR5_9GAMM|nr:VOC family protein [Thalassotalea algicola]NMP31285.1 VOC family protein [Thalassotalea algicola]